MKRGRKKGGTAVKAPAAYKYRYALHEKHHSGIGSIFIRYVYTDLKPCFENGFWLDVTNGEWARWH